MQKFLQTRATLPAWHKRLDVVFIGLIVLEAAMLIFGENLGRGKRGFIIGSDDSDTFQVRANLFCFLAFGLMTYVARLRTEAYPPARPLFLMLAPYTGVVLAVYAIRNLFPDLYKSYDGIIGALIVFAFIWLFSLTVYANRQKKTFQTEIVEREQEAERIKKERIRLESLVAARTADLTLQKEELQKALDELKAAQAQLVHAEKMASLGELTAGIAHEIQNPLNFVNNFAEVSTELIDELAEERSKLAAERDEGLEGELLDDIKQNLAKISQHGQRASGIVRGMLQHSRNSTGQKEATDLNALADEYLRLAYHGLRAKDKTFNATLKTDFDAQLGKLNVVPQELGRVLLNLLTNAFHATQQRAKAGEAGYQPTVTVATKKGKKAVEIRVMDNGTGMPESVKAKIFQPFFTTKPTGQGTGLGLSLSYDIVTKGHGGTLTVESTEGQGTTFIVSLPVTESKER